MLHVPYFPSLPRVGAAGHTSPPLKHRLFPNVKRALPLPPPPELTPRLALAHRSAILGPALDDYVGTILAKKGDINGPGSATDREFLQTEIRLLKQNLAEYERSSNGDERKELQAGLVKQQEDQKDIFQYLNGELAKKTDEIVALEERVLKLEEENDQSIREHEVRLLSQKDAAELEIGKLHKQLGEFKEQLQEVRRPLWLPQPRPS
jgi:hypothetical protein